MMPVSARHHASSSANMHKSSSSKSGHKSQAHKSAASKRASSNTRGKAGYYRRSGRQSSRKSTRSRGRVVSSRYHHHHSVQKAEAPLEAPPDFEGEPRRRNYALLSQAYSLYDHGASERLSGNFGESVESLSRAYSILEQARSHQRDNKPSSLEAMVLFELAQAAESDGDLTLARDSYCRCLIASPRFAEAYLRVCDLLARQGDLPLAAKFARDGVSNCPEDSRISEMNDMLANLLKKSD